jgi:hypothetical protein
MFHPRSLLCVRGRPLPPPFARGNPGKKPGTRNRATVLTEKLLSKDLKHIASKIVELAKQGDLVAAKLILDRVARVPKGRRVSFAWPDGVGLDAIGLAFDSVLRAIGDGKIAIDEGLGIVAILEKKVTILQADEVAREIAELKAAIQGYRRPDNELRCFPAHALRLQAFGADILRNQPS